jgi:hypothetical protein
MEDKRLAAENKRADIDRDVRKKKAEAEQDAAQNELATKLAIAAKQCDNDLKRVGFKAETDRAQAEAGVEVAQRDAQALKIAADASAEKIRKEGQD